MTHEVSRVLAKIEKLVAMTSSPHLEEARTSAFMACRLIRDYGLQVVAYRVNPAPEPEYQPAPKPEPDSESVEEFIPIRVKNKSYCRSCKKTIEVGDSALWCKGKGLLHFHCKAAYQR